MKKIHGEIIKDHLGSIGDCYYNDFAVNVYETDSNKILLVKLKLGHKVPGHWAVMNKEFFYKNFNSDNFTNFGNFLRACNYLDPDCEDWESVED